MKTKNLILFGLLAIALTACNLNGSVNNTPEIIFITKPIANNVDSLGTFLTDQGGVYQMDTINVGDTVSFHILLYGFSNNLTSLYLVQSDTTTVKFLIPPKASLDSVFSTSDSDYANGKFIFKNNITSLYFPFKLVAKKASKEVKFMMTLKSDADFSKTTVLATSSAQVTLITPIVLPK